MEFIRLLKKLNTRFKPLYFAQGNSFTLPANRHLTLSAIENKPNSYFLNAGVSYLNTNAGLSPVDEGLVVSDSSVFIGNSELIYNYSNQSLGGKALELMTQSECEAAIDAFIDSRPGGYGTITNGMSEWNDLYKPYSPSYSHFSYQRGTPQQYMWLDRRLAFKARQKNGESFGDYDGSTQVGNLAVSNPNLLIQAYSNPAQMLQLVKENTASGSGNPAFNENCWSYRGLLVNIYFGSQNVQIGHLARVVCDFEAVNICLNHVGAPNTRVMGFMFPGKREFPGENWGYSENYKRDMGSKGYYESYGFPAYSMEWQKMLAYITFTFATDLKLWEDTLRFGDNPDVVLTDYFRQSDNFPMSKYYGSGATVANQPHKYENRDVGYFTTLSAVAYDQIMLGIENYCKMIAWAGQSSVWTSYKEVGGSYFQVRPSYMVDCVVNNRAICRLHKNGNRRAFFYYDVVGEAGTSVTRTIDLQGGEFTGEFEKGITYFILIDLAAGGVA